VPLGRICPGCGAIVVGACPKGCRPGGKRLTPRRARNQKVWSSSFHKTQRLRIFRRDDFACRRCPYRDDTQTGKGLIADHIHGIDEVRIFRDEELQTLCEPCSGQKDGQRGVRLGGIGETVGRHAGW
jgi:5-methylcytosine-specific restriction endonuclease McrA